MLYILNEKVKEEFNYQESNAKFLLLGSDFPIFHVGYC